MRMLLYQGKNRSFQILGSLLLFLSLIGCTNPEGDSSTSHSSIDAKNTTSEEVSESLSTAPAQSENSEEQPEKPEIPDSSQTTQNGQSSSTSFPQEAKLTADDTDVQINVASESSQQASSKGYGLVGDAVSVLDVTTGSDGTQWYQVKFEGSETVGWVEENFVKRWNIRESLLKGSQLNPAQAEKLMTVEGGRVQGGENGDGIFRVVLPGYVPNGFKLTDFSFGDRKSESGAHIIGLEYFLTYEDSNNACFRVGAYVPPAGLPFGVETIEVYSPTLGKLLLNYTEFDEYSNQPKIELDSFSHLPGGYVYDFASPDAPLYDEANCNTMELEEAVKVVKSLEYLNP
ncbi:MAG: hypothetical protein AAF703_08500 [Cyanobacteria bacterium P01_D01_bin.105]